MQLQTSRDVWGRLSPSEASDVAEQIAQLLTEELEHERIDQGITYSLETPCGRLPEAIRPQAGARESRERAQSTRVDRAAA